MLINRFDHIISFELYSVSSFDLQVPMYVKKYKDEK